MSTSKTWLSFKEGISLFPKDLSVWAVVKVAKYEFLSNITPCLFEVINWSLDDLTLSACKSWA